MMNHPVTSISSTPWLRADNSLSRTTTMTCDIGEFEYQILLAFKRGEGGQVDSLVGFRLNHRPWGDDSEDGKWFNVHLRSSELEGPAGAFLCDEEGNHISLISGDAETFKDFASTFFIERDWTVVVQGQHGPVTSFPLPRDDSFPIEFTKLLDDVRTNVAD